MASVTVRRLMCADGRVRIDCDPMGALPSRWVEVRTAYSAISLGTELEQIATSGDVPLPLGYSASGIASSVGAQVTRFHEGERVAIYGQPFVYHGSRLQVPETLVAKVPDAVPLRLAAFGGMGAIAMHAVRMAQVGFGERLLVVGLGPIGRLAAEIALVAGLDVVCVERDPQRARLATHLVVQDSLASVKPPFDAALLAAHGDGELLDQAAGLLRDQGTLVIVGDVPIAASRSVLFANEARLVVSRAGGPGRYDPDYEQQAIDYQPGLVRWSEGRNLSLFVNWLDRRLQLSEWVTHETALDEAPALFEMLCSSRSAALGVLIRHTGEDWQQSPA